MAEIPNIDFEHAATLMDVVQKVASVAPAYMAISSVAMAELKEMNEEAQAYLNQLGQERLQAEQEAAAELNRQNLEAAKENERAEAEIAKRTAASNAVKPITVMPGEPVPDVVREHAGEIPETDSPQFPEEPDPTPVARRV